ncbi:MAG TPA: prepilin peptidase [Patescibacteria group bacterium]|nr:prepilin peptidase [Patescibacteria group bacterium]
MLRGKCAKCKHAISFQYPLIEVVTGIFFVFTWFQLGPYFLSDYLLLFRNWFVILICIAVFVIDLRHKLILDVITFPSIILLLVCNIWLDYLQGSFLTLDSYTLGGLVAGTAASLLFYLFWFFSKGTWIGFGDVKFAWVMGLALGFPGALFAVMLAAYLGVFVSIPLLLLKKASFKTQLPFGCFLSASVLVLVFFSSTLLDIYIKYFAVY